jgi:hypothetical protein
MNRMDLGLLLCVYTTSELKSQAIGYGAGWYNLG